MTAGVLIGWVPSAFFDECVPGLRATPDAWLRIGDHAYLDGSEDDLEAVPVNEGERVTFHSLTSFPDVQLRWSGRAQDAMVDGAVAPDATSVCIIGDPDSVSENVDALKIHMRVNGYETGTYVVRVYRWCDGVDFLHRGGIFTRVGSA